MLRVCLARVEGMPAGVVSQTTLRLPAADLGSESPLPPFTGLQRLPDPSSSAELAPDMRERIAYGRLANPLPYALQNGYSRDLRSRDISALRLSNGLLEASVVPSLGGRLWSLRELRPDRDLVFANRRLQFANLALTDAWFAGGIEWNLGSTGHSATTCRPVFTGSVPSNRGSALRIWEWERTRDLVFSVDLLMPADRPLLLAFVRIRNPDHEPKPLYWWTNIAVPEEPGVRVVAPATRAWRTGYDRSFAPVDIPFADDSSTDVSYPLPTQRAADYFFQVPAERRPWIAAVQADGRGLVQTSTDHLRGRKLFCWGTAAGGRHWQEWLCGPESRYLEIQAGLAATQLEHLRLEGRAEISWAEAYAPIEATPAAHGSWPDAVAEVAALVARAVPDLELDAWHRWWRAEVADAAPQQMTAGSGAGEAELVVRGDQPDGLPGTPFGQPLSDGFRHLVALVRAGKVDPDVVGADVLIPPMTDRWDAVLDGAADGWWGQLMKAIRSHARGDLEAARLGYLHSDELFSTPWTARGLALLAVSRGDHPRAAELYARAVALAPTCLPLLVEASEHLLAAGQPPAACLAIIDAAPTQISGHGRLVLQRARALLAGGRADAARALLEAGIEVPDLREGETLGELWRAAFGDRPLPYHYDFRMRPDLDG
jgi:uncharacterized protein DUF5107